MPRAYKAHPDHPAVGYLLRLHADIGGQIIANREEGARLDAAMRNVEAVIKLFDPAFDVRPVAVRRRKGNPWFRRGSLFRQVLDVLRAAEGPLTSRELTVRVLAERGIADANNEAVRDLACSVNTCLRRREGTTVKLIGEGIPARWVVGS